MALSEFYRLSFDPFLEMRRMQTEMNRLFSGLTFATTRGFRRSTSGSMKIAAW
jgi:hypothetical protein